MPLAQQAGIHLGTATFGAGTALLGQRSVAEAFATAACTLGQTAGSTQPLSVLDRLPAGKAKPQKAALRLKALGILRSACHHVSGSAPVESTVTCSAWFSQEQGAPSISA